MTAAVWTPENGGTDIWIFEANGRESRRLTFPPDVHRRPVLSPDGSRLAMGRSVPNGPPEIVTIETDGNGKEHQFTTSDPNGRPPHGLPTDWSRDGRFIAFDTGIPDEEPEVWIADVGAGKVMPLLQDKSSQWGAAFSPDVKQIAFVSSGSGRSEVYVQGFSATPLPHVVGERRQVSRDGAWLVRWRGDGRELFYLGADNWLRSVSVAGPLGIGEPKPLFRIPGASQYATTSDFQFDVSPNGQRFFMSTTGSAPPPPFTVIENWQDKFRR
jgi:Tol biopolymer transport system component